MLPTVGTAQGDVELDEAKRTYFDEAYAALPRANHYELLGVPRDADKKALKRAYFGLAATVHPDRHFGKKLGPYKAKMEVLFTRITIAFEVLSDPKARAAYDHMLPPPRPGAQANAPTAVAPKQPVDPKVLAKRQEAMDALKARFADGKSKVPELLATAKRARAAGDLAAAAEAYRQALLFTPDDDEVGTAYVEVQREVAERLVESFVKKAQLEERFEQWAQAAESWSRVTLARPNDAAARARLAAATERAGKA
jgi:curved DNA-binding protein CbpA